MNVIVVLLSAVIGASASGVWGLASQAINRRNTALGIANAISSEISALIAIVERRQYIAGFKRAIEENRPIIIAIRQRYFQVYDANCDKIGLLSSDLASDIAKFYTYANLSWRM